MLIVVSQKLRREVSREGPLNPIISTLINPLNVRSTLAPYATMPKRSKVLTLNLSRKFHAEALPSRAPIRA